MTQHMIDYAAQAEILIEALPYMLKYDETTVVVKYGGHAMGDEEAALDFARDVVMLKQSGLNPIVVHGGGPQIGKMLERLGVKSEFKGGLRVTDKETVEIVEMVLAGTINKQIVGWINHVGGKAVGLCGKDGNMVIAKKLKGKSAETGLNDVDLGFVGEPELVNRAVLDDIIKSDLIPVIAPVAISKKGETYNLNADTFAGAIAGAMGAKRLLLLTDVPGVLDKNKELLSDLTVAQTKQLIKDGVITGGMIPKVETCFYALDQGVEAVVILDGKVPHAVLIELFTEHGAGTFIKKG